MLNEFPELNHKDIDFDSPTFTLLFSKSPDPHYFQLQSIYRPQIKVVPESFYLIKSMNFFGSIPENIFETLSFYDLNDDKTPFPTFGLTVEREDQPGLGSPVNSFPISFGKYGRVESYFRFVTNEAIDANTQQVLSLNLNSNPQFKVSQEFLDFGKDYLSIGIKLELYKVSAKWWIEKYWERGATPGQNRQYDPRQMIEAFENLNRVVKHG